MSNINSIKIDIPVSIEKTTYNDDFQTEIKDLKDFEGLSHNFKRTKIAKAVGQGNTSSKQLYPEQIISAGYGLFDVVIPPYNLLELASFYDNSSAIHSAVNAKVANIVGLGYDFEVSPTVRQSLEELEAERLVRAQRKVERTKASVREWLESLNDEDTFIHTLEKVWTDVETTGNGYIEIGRTVTGEIGYIGHIPAITMRVRRKRDGFVQIVSNKVVFFRNYNSKTPNPITADGRPNEIIHIKKYSSRNSYYGIPDTVAAATSVVGNDLAGKFNVDFFENKAVPRYIALLKGATLSAESEDKLFRFLQSGLRGQNHRTLFIPLPPDTPESKVEFDMKPVESGILEASFIEYRKENTNDTLMAHGVPRSRVGGEANQNIAAALAADRTFKESVARPAQDRLEKMLNKIIAEKTDILQLKMNELSLTDEITQSQIDERYLRNSVITPNEVRPRLGLPMKNESPDQQQERQQQVQQQQNQQQAEQNVQAAGTRQRDQERVNNASDSPSTTTGRNPQGEGRRQQ